MYIFLVGGEDLELTNCDIASNTSVHEGGGIWADVGAGTVSLRGCTVASNSANPGQARYDSDGGGIYLASGSLVLEHSEVRNNAAYSKTTGGNATTLSHGGGIYADGNVELTNCQIMENRAWAIDADVGGREHNYSYGGGVYKASGQLKATNCLISGNSCNPDGSHPSALGSGVYLASGTSSITNCTIAYNNAEGLRIGTGVTEAVNSIFYFNGTQQVVGAATVTYSDVQGGFAGAGNIEVDPDFVDAPADLHIGPASPCIDAGTNSAVHVGDDFEGDPRIADGNGDGTAEDGTAVVDMGADERRPCAGDCDGYVTVTVDEIINLVNIVLGIAQPSPCPHGVPTGATVDITLIIQAVNNDLGSCSAS